MAKTTYINSNSSVASYGTKSIANATLQNAINKITPNAVAVDSKYGPNTQNAYNSLINQGYTYSNGAFTKPVNPLASFTYNDQASKDAKDIADINANIGNANPTQDEMNATLRTFQGQIDALNAVYANERSRLMVENQNRLGQVGSIAGNRGLAGSNVGDAMYKGQENENTAVLNTADAKHNADIQAIYGKISEDAKTMAKNRYDAAKNGADAMIENIKNTALNREKAVKSAVQYIIDSGVDPSKVTPEQVQTMVDAINKGNPRFNVTAGDITSAYLTAKKVADEAKAKTDLETEKTRAEMAKPVSSGDYTYMYDPVSKTYKNVGSNKKPDASSIIGASGEYVKGVNPSVDAWAQRIFDGSAKITDIPASEKGMRDLVTRALVASGNDLAGKPTVTELGRAAKSTAETLMNKLTTGSGTGGVGKSSMFNWATIPGTAKKDFINTFNALKSQLSLEGVKYLKGQGQVSDAERALLAQAVTKLNLGQSETEFKTTLQGIIDKLNGNPDGNVETTGNTDFSKMSDEELQNYINTHS